MSDELKTVLEDVKKKFNMVKERLDRHEKTEEERFERIEDKLILFQKDFNEHRNNTELHAVKKKKMIFMLVSKPQFS